jgi:1-acyl-sn-glycerol-3-phosphate acyltransferase
VSTSRRRRGTAVVGVVLAFMIAVPLSPALFALAVLADVCTPRTPWRHVRLLAMGVLTLAIEVAGLAGLAVLWIASAGRPRRLQGAHFALQNWWTGALLTAAHATLGLRVTVDDPRPAAGGNAIVIGRHASIGDAAIPAVLLGHHHRLRVRYVLKHDLQWDPCIEVVGRRVGHLFVDRSDAGGQAGEDLRRLGGLVGPGNAVVIFPEGTFFSAERQARAIERLSRGTRPELAGRAAALRHLLPPRPAGTLALLDGAPGADVVVVGHIGFERFTSLRAIYRAVPFREPVQVWLWRVPRHTIPEGDAARVGWLYDEWERLDASIVARLAKP